MITAERVRKIDSEETFFAFLSEELQWPFENAPDTFPFYADELGLTAQDAAQIESVTQIANFELGQPFGIFLVKFSGERVYQNALRRVLRGLSETRRDRDAGLPAWKAPNLLFLCTTNYCDWTVARFSGASHTRATLSLFGWKQKGDEGLRTLCEHNLQALIYPDNPADANGWLKKWAAAFDVGAATDRFYKKYEEIFKKVEALIQNAAGEKRLFTQCLMNRLMFIHFLSKKGWLTFKGRTDYLAALWEERDPTQNFYYNHVYPLFFVGLNNPESQQLKRDDPSLTALIGNVPYLNGGLFEEGSCDNKGEKIEDEAFRLVIEELFLPFNFTVTESTPLDIEVAVDPEMLGQVFEKLMTGPLREGKGAYYTPRSVVTFMCREALKGYLAQTPSDAPKQTISAERIARLVDLSDDQAVSLAEAKRLLARLTKLRAVDPACGSGAYLLGMMQELFTLTCLLDTRAENQKARDDYERKLGLIQNNLYGVDIDPFAVNVAMLRLWLSLIVDYREADPTNLPPLPNLDFKIERGDSLLAPDPQGISDLFRRELIDKADDLKRLKSQYFTVQGAAKKELREKIETAQTNLIAALHQDLPEGAFEWRVQFAEVFKPEVADITVGGAMNFGQELAEADVPGGFHIVIANPPYGVKVSEATRQAYFPDASQSKDTYGLFMARALQLLCEGGQFCYIVSDTWRTIRSHLPLRKMLLEQATAHHVIDLPDWIFDATVNTGIVTLTKAKAPAGHKLIAGDLRGLERGDWNALETNLKIMAARGVDVQTPQYARYTYPQSQIADYENRPFFIASPKLYSLMSDARFQRLESIAEVRQGLATADNEYYIRKRAGVRGSYTLLNEAELLTEAEIAALSDSEKKDGVNPADYGGRRFVPYDKGGESDAEGGWMPNYWVPTGYFIDWSQAAVNRLRTATIADVKRRKGESNQIKASDETTRAAVIRNPQFYFRNGVTFSPTGIYSPTFRMGCNSIFGNKGSTLFSDSVNPNILLGLLATTLSRYLLKNYSSHTVETGEEVLGQLPLAQLEPKQETQLAELVEAIIEKQKAAPRYEYHLYEQREIDALVYELYGLNPDDIREVELWYCRRYARLARTQGVWDDVQTRYAAYLERAALLLAKPPGYWRSHPVYELIAQGEGPRLDFKRHFGVDSRGAESRASVESVMKEIAAFCNTDGGAILLGVADNGEIVGIESDLPFVTHQNADGLALKIRQCMERDLSPNPGGAVEIAFDTLPEGTVCRVEVAPVLGVTYFKEAVYRRDGNRTVPLTGRELVEWTLRRRG